MKILIVNKFLYPRGGSEIYALNMKDLLEQHRHEVKCYAMKYPLNISCDESRYFAEEVSFFNSSYLNKAKAAARVLWGHGVYEGFVRLLDDFRPDVIHLNNIHSYLSPCVASIAHQRGIKVIWTLHDYKLLCPSYSCLYHGQTCTCCFDDKFQVVKKKCMRNSCLASVLGWLEILLWNKERLCRWTTAFISPSYFLLQQMELNNFPKERLFKLWNFIGSKEHKSIGDSFSSTREEAYAYIGRLSQEKGITFLLNIATSLPYKLYVVGDGPLLNQLKAQYESDKIIFLGRITLEKVILLLNKVQFTVMPSIWYENNPLSVIESLCCGTPVLGRNIGGIPELLETSPYNALFNDDAELLQAIPQMFNRASSVDRKALSTSSLQLFSAENYYKRWMEIVNSRP